MFSDSKSALLIAATPSPPMMRTIGWGAGGTAPSTYSSVSAAGVAALGAEGVYCGTRFMVSEECPYPDVTKQALIDTRVVDMVNIGGEWYNYHLTRTPNNVEFAETHSILASDGDTSEYSARGDAAVWGMMTGELEDGGVNCGLGIDSIDSVLPAADIVNEIATAFGL